MDAEQMPKWTIDLKSKYNASIAHTFVLHGNIQDYVVDNIPLRDFLTTKVFHKREMIIYYNSSTGISFPSAEMEKEFREATGVPEEVAIPKTPEGSFPFIEKIMTNIAYNGKVFVFIEYPELVFPAVEYGSMNLMDRFALATLLRWANEPNFSALENPIILATRVVSDLHSSLKSASNKVEAIHIPYPETSERLDYLEYILKETNAEIDPKLEVKDLASLTGGLSRVGIEDIVLRSLERKYPLDLDLIKERKDSIVESEFQGIVEIINPDYGFEQVGGMDNIKAYLQRSVINPLRNQGMQTHASRGALFTGPPGTGKTLMATAMASESKVNFVKLNIGRLLNSYVGTSERNLELALGCIKSLRPTIVFIDEIDQQLQRGNSGDSGVSRRIFARILDVMSTDELGARGEIFWIAATNKIADVDSALRRQGRFDKIIPFIPGDEKERLKVLISQLKKSKISKVDANTLKKIALTTDGYTPSDLEGLCVKALEFAYDNEYDPSQDFTEYLVKARDVLKPSTPKHELEEMIKEAVEYCNDSSLLPENIQKTLHDEKE